jgi:triacylglycerol esterase/lipase EstA (alpha/beta hydrolase family)
MVPDNIKPTTVPVTYIYIFTYTNMYMYNMYTHTYTYTCVHTHIHTHFTSRWVCRHEYNIFIPMRKKKLVGHAVKCAHCRPYLVENKQPSIISRWTRVANPKHVAEPLHIIIFHVNKVVRRVKGSCTIQGHKNFHLLSKICQINYFKVI